jgi:hypothetical protein
LFPFSHKRIWSNTKHWLSKNSLFRKQSTCGLFWVNINLWQVEGLLASSMHSSPLSYAEKYEKFDCETNGRKNNASGPGEHQTVVGENN